MFLFHFHRIASNLLLCVTERNADLDTGLTSRPGDLVPSIISDRESRRKCENRRNSLHDSWPEVSEWMQSDSTRELQGETISDSSGCVRLLALAVLDPC